MKTQLWKAALLCPFVLTITLYAQNTVTTPGGTVNTVPKYSGSATIINSAIFESGGKVGIGTVAPSSTLTVNGTLNASGTSILDNAFRFYKGNFDGLKTYADFRSETSIPNLIINAPSGGVVFNYDHGTGGVQFANGAGGIYAQITAAGNAIFAGTGNSSFAGNLGIGTASPSSKLTVVGLIQSTSGGIKFPDNTVQTTATLKGPPGPAGPQGSQGPQGATGADGPQGLPGPNTQAIAQLKWYTAILVPPQFSVGSGPFAVAFDGASIWVTNNNDATVTKLRASDGFNLGTFQVKSPGAVAFDGANIWVTNFGDNTVTKLRASDGSLLGTFPVGNAPLGVAFDGANIWVTNETDNTVTKLLASDGSTVGTFPVGSDPVSVAFDGANIWVTNLFGNTVTKLLASDGSLLGTFPVGNSPGSLAFDGANIWVTNGTRTGTVTKLRASDGRFLGRFAVGDSPVGIAFDGVYLWVANFNSGTVSKL